MNEISIPTTAFG